MNRLKMEKGETLVETLVSMMICVFAILLLFSSIFSSKVVIDKSDKKMTEYYEKNNSLVEKTEASGKGVVTFSKPIIPSENIVSVEYFVNDVFSNNPVVTYAREKD